MKKLLLTILVWTRLVYIWTKKNVQAFITYICADNKMQLLYRNAHCILDEYTDKECERLDIKKPWIVVAPLEGKKGEYYADRLVVIDPCSADNIPQTLCHELRHEWQFHNRRELMEWCHKNVRTRERESGDEAFYWLNPVEIDARYYAASGDIAGTIDIYSIPQMEQMMQDGSFLSAMAQIAYDYGVVPRTLWDRLQFR